MVMSLILLGSIRNSFSDAQSVLQENVDNINKVYENLTNKNPPRLWIHVRSQEQMMAIKKPEIEAWLESIKLDDKKIDLRPIELVDSGPKESQLRFFFKQDINQADQFLKKLKDGLPLLQLKDFSGQYENILEPGHFELWLAPETVLKSPVGP